MAKAECANCGESFEKSVHNQIYHNDECCKEATAKQLSERYYKEKKRKAGLKRLCDRDCGTVLSRYNPDDTCSMCSRKVSTGDI